MALSIALVATAMGLGVAAPSQAAIKTTLIVSAAKSSIASGQNAVITATLRKAGKPSARAQVTLQKRATGQKSWTKVGSTKTNTKGQAKFTVKRLTSSLEFRAVFAGSKSLSKSTSRIIPVKLTKLAATSLKLDSSASSVNSNGATYLKATLKRGTKPASNFTIQLQKRTKGAASWTRIGSYKTNAGGKATNRVSGLTKNTEFRAIFAGTSTSKKATSKIKIVTVKQQTAITAVSSSKPTSGDKVTFSGTVSAALVGKTLNLQQLKGSAWTNIASAKATSKKTFSVTTPVSGVGSTKFRVSVSKTVDTSVAISPQKTLTLHKWYWLDDVSGEGYGMKLGTGYIAGQTFDRSILAYVYEDDLEDLSYGSWKFQSSCTSVDMYIGVDDDYYDSEFTIWMGGSDGDEGYTLGVMAAGEDAKKVTKKLIDKNSLFLGAAHAYGYDDGYAVFGNPRVLCAGKP